MSFLQPSDFVGKVAQGKNEFTEPKQQLYFDRYEKRYLQDLLGCTMYDEFIADLDTAPNITPASVPTSQKFLDIFNEFCIDDGVGSGCQRKSEGIKEMLKFFLFWEYARDNQFAMAITGATENNFSNSTLIKLAKTQAYENYNTAIETYQAIQWFILDNPNAHDYSNYNGESKDFTSWL